MSNISSQIMKHTRHAIIDYNMIANDEGILVGLSGGKDSLTLLAMLAEFRQHSKYKFPLAAGHVDLGFAGDIPAMQRFCADLAVPFYYEPTNISEIVFEIRAEKNPCSLCAKMRRGALNTLAKKYNYPKVALAHHQDDVTETLLLNLCFEGRADSFKPVTWLSNQELTVIRPFIYVPEKLIIDYASASNLPIIASCCPANGHTKRQDMKELLATLQTFCPGAQGRMIHALQGIDGNDWQRLLRDKIPAKNLREEIK